jgi:hypothetical protein
MPKKKTKRSSNKLIFRKHANIGSADAIEDKKFLEKTFLDNGELDILADSNEPKCIILGRTGSGKTALLERLSDTKERAIKIAPEGLALTYVSNNDVLNFFTAVGVNMDLFYRLLWRHVFAVEIIKVHYKIVNEKARDNFLIQIKDRLSRNKSRQEAIDYFVKCGESFWKESDYRVKEVTETLENDLGLSLGTKLKGQILGVTDAEVNFNTELAKRLTKEQKAEIIRRGQQVVDRVQMLKLSEVMDILNEILDDKQKKYYITIDRLDENWVNDNLRFRLIRALLDTVRELNHKIQNAKIIIAIREDLLDRVFRYTRDPGYQEEKYKSLYLTLTWNENELEELLY